MSPADAAAPAVLVRVRLARDLLAELKLELQAQRLSGDEPLFVDRVLGKVDVLDAQLVVAEKGLLLDVALRRVDAAGESEASAGAPVGPVPEAIRDALLQARERIAAEPPAAFDDPPCPRCGACADLVTRPSGLTEIGGVREYRCTKCRAQFFSEVSE